MNNNFKMWYFFVKKNMKNRNLEKISSEYNNNIYQLSDEESDKTVTEKINIKNNFPRGRKLFRSKKNNENNKNNYINDCNTNRYYDKRDKSLDIIRNNNKIDYEVVMSYQRYNNLRTIKIFDKNEIIKMDNEMLISNRNLIII